jgi:hypothetical protein
MTFTARLADVVGGSPRGVCRVRPARNAWPGRTYRALSAAPFAGRVLLPSARPADTFRRTGGSVFDVDDYDGECDVYRMHWHVARKPHRCACCGYLVPAGAQYQRHNMVGDGYASSEACCWACAAGLWQLMEEHRTHPSPSWAIEFLRNEIGQLARCEHDEVAMERDVLAGMVRRNRAACRAKETKP